MKLLRAIDKVLRAVFMVLVRGYQRFFSPWLPPSCRFIPTCSNYALEALHRKTFPAALWLICRRIVRCNPFSRGGYDPLD